jgi:Fe2+ or Zn2+ uptake regulation protein
MNQILDSWKDSMRQRGYRITRPRLQVMEIITKSKTALTPQEIYHQSLDSEQPPGIASVYRTLEMLDELGLIQQIHQPDGCHGIWPALEGHKHLLLCTNCNDMQVIEGNEEISDYINMIEEQTSYQVKDHWLQLFGLCTGCLDLV